MTQNQFNIEVGTTLNTQGASKALKDFVEKSKRITNIIDLGDGYRQFDTLTRYVDKAGNSFQRFNRILADSNGESVVLNTQTRNITSTFQGVTRTFKNTIVETDKYGRTITTVTDSTKNLKTVTTEWKDSQGALVKNIREYNASTDKLIHSHREYIKDLNEIAEAQSRVANAQKDITTTTTQTQGIINRQGQSYQALITTTEKVASNGGYLRTVTTEYKDAMGYAVKESQNFDKTGKAISGVTKEMSKGIEQTTQSSKKLGQSFSDIVTKVTKFYLASLPIRAVQKVVTETVTAVKEFDDAITEMGKVSSLAGDSLQKYTIHLGELGTEVARTRTEMVELATGFIKAGMEDQADVLAKVAALYQNTADEELSAADATSVLISQMKAFGYTTEEEAMHITDAINRVSQDFAISSGDIGRGLTQAGAALSTYGNSYEQVVGLLTAGTEIFQGRSQQVARGLNTVASRVAKNEEELKKYGVNIYDTNHQLKSTYDILSELAPKWKTMDAAQKVSLGTTLAGVNQYKVFAAVMGNFETAISATGEALNSEGATLEQNAVYMDSLEAKLTELKTEFQNLVLGGGGLQNFSKLIVDIGIKILKLANSDIGQLIIKTVLLTEALNLLGKAIKSNMVSSIVEYIKSIIIVVSQLTAETITLAGAMEALNINPIILALTALSAIIVLTTNNIIKQARALQDANSALQEYNSNVSQTQSEIDRINQNLESTEKRLQEIQKRIQEINSNGGLVLTDSTELELLEKESKQLSEQESTLKRQLALAQSKLEVEQKIAIEQARATLNTKTESRFESDTNDGANDIVLASTFGGDVEMMEAAGYQYSSQVTPLEELTRATEEYTKAKKELDELDENQSKKKNVTQEELADYEKKRDAIKERMREAQDVGNQMSDILTETSNALVYSTSEADKKIVESNQSAIDNFLESIGILDKAKQDEIATQEEFLEQKKQVEEKLGFSIDDLISEKIASGAEDEWEALQLILDEYKEQLTETSNALFDFSKKTDISVDKLKAQAESMGLSEQEFIKYAEEEAKALNISVEQLLLNADALGVNIEKYKELSEAISRTNSKTDEIQSAYSLLKKAMEEYNEYGAYSIDTMQQLLTISPKYLDYLKEENGVMSLNKEGMEQLIEAQKQEAIEQAYHIAIARLDALATAQAGGSSIVTAQQKRDAAKGVDIETEAYKANSKALYENAVANAYKRGASDEEIKKIINDLENQINAIKNSTNSMNDFASATSKASSEASKLKSQYEKAFSAVTDAIQKNIDALNKQKDAALDAIDKQISAMEKQRDAELKAIEKEKTALEKEKEARQKYWDDQIEALKKENEARQESLELQEKQEALARAKQSRVMVLEDGKFVYKQDEQAVAQAEQELFDYEQQRSYEQQLAKLEELKQAEMDSYDERIKALEEYYSQVQEQWDNNIKAMEEYRDQVEEQYEAEIKYYEDLKEQFEDLTKSYEEEQGKLLASQLLGIDLEQANWTTRLNNAQEFVSKYNAILAQLDDGTGNTKNYSNTKDIDKSKYDHYYTVDDNGNTVDSVEIGDKTSSMLDVNELSSVVPSNRSGNVGIDALARDMGSNFGNGNTSSVITNNASNDTNITIGSIELPQVSDAQDFIDGLKNFKTSMTQLAYARG